MNFKNEYAEKYKSLSNADLLNVIDNPADFRPEAVEAAKIELESRNLTDNELDEAKELLKSVEILRRQRKQKTEQTIQSAYDKVITRSGYFDERGRIILSGEHLIKLISISLSIIFLISIFKNYNLLSYSINNFHTNELIDDLSLWLPFITLPAGIIFFALRKRIGWYLLAIYLSYILLSSIISLIYFLIYYENSMPELFPIHYSYANGFLKIVIYGIILFYMSLKSVINMFDIESRQMKTTIGITAFLTFFAYLKFLI